MSRPKGKWSADILCPQLLRWLHRLEDKNLRAVVEIVFEVPGAYMLMDHSVFRTKQGATGMIDVEGAPRPDIYDALKN